MITETKKAFALAALIVATGIAAVELTRSSAQADPMLVTGGAAGYAGARVDAAFEAVAEMPEAAAVMVPLAEKGDLPVPYGCEGNAEAECMDVAYEVESAPSVVVETRIGNTSTLMRMDAMTVAGVNDEPAQLHE
jgi:hypothetical protein